MSWKSLVKALFVILLLLIGAMQTTISYAAVSEPTHASPYEPVPGASMECVAQQAGLTLMDLAVENNVLNPTLLSQLTSVSLPETSPALTSAPLPVGETRLTTAIRQGVSLWTTLRYNPVTVYTQGYVTLPGTASACLPYPVIETAQINASELSIKQGQVKLLGYQLAEGSMCDVSYLGTSTPCYVDDDGWQYALISVNALVEPGTYPVTVTATGNGITSKLSYDLVVESAYYGFQYIDPPPELDQLLDARFMQEELDYLAKWRSIRTGERLWELPLAFPLAVQTSISADYGAERSYGGMVDGYHSGVDYRATLGTPVIAPADGTVLLSEYLPARGNAILIDHGWGLVSGYWHCSESHVAVGQHVHQGDVIALVGNTGLSTGPHLHWEVWVNGISIDGKQWLTEDLYGDCPLAGCLFALTPDNSGTQ